jgi:hypothetical protein
MLALLALVMPAHASLGTCAWEDVPLTSHFTAHQTGDGFRVQQTLRGPDTRVRADYLCNRDGSDVLCTASIATDASSESRDSQYAFDYYVPDAEVEFWIYNPNGGGWGIIGSLPWWIGNYDQEFKSLVGAAGGTTLEADTLLCAFSAVADYVSGG